MKHYQSGTLIERANYKSFEPSEINRAWEISSPKVLQALSVADRNIGRLDMFSEYIPDLDLFVEMHVTKEATQSSKIEDTQTEMEEALLPIEEISLERRDDWEEVRNYIAAMNESVASLEDLPFSNRLIKSTHRRLMQGVRGETKTPGEYRMSQNWIGGSSPSNARFVPPFHDNVAALMGDLELFAHNLDIHIPPLIKVAIIHYQFETIHPFLDGNGRVGRLLIPLFLISESILKKPVLYVSDFLEKNRTEYYQRLTDVRDNNDLEGWLIFFLNGVSETARKGVDTFNNVLQFQKQWVADISSWTSQSSFGLALFNELLRNPIVNAQMVADVIDASMPTAYKLLDKFVDCGLLKILNEGKRNRLFICAPYLEIYK